MTIWAIHRLIAFFHPFDTRLRTGSRGEEASSRPDIPTPAVLGWSDNCPGKTRFESLDEAMRVRAAHTDHVPLCRPYLGAIAYLGGLNNDDYE